MKICIDTAGWYNEKDPQASLEYIKACGFEAIDFGMYEYLDTMKFSREGHYHNIFDLPTEQVIEYFEPLKKASEKTGISIGQMHAPFPIWFEGRPELDLYNLQALEKCLAVCEYLDCPAIVVHPSRRPERAAEFEVNLENYRALIPMIKKFEGIKICTENIFTHRGRRIIEGRLSNPDDACALVDALNAEAGGEYFGFCLDVGHAVLTGNKIKEFIKSLGKRLTLLHIHDNDGLYDLHMIPYSYLYHDKIHVVDWDGLVEGLSEIGYEGNLSFETCNLCNAYPKEVHAEAHKLVSAIGRFWVKRING